jgi:predicted outer membrane repeat protein
VNATRIRFHRKLRTVLCGFGFIYQLSTFFTSMTPVTFHPFTLAAAALLVVCAPATRAETFDFTGDVSIPQNTAVATAVSEYTQKSTPASTPAVSYADVRNAITDAIYLELLPLTRLTTDTTEIASYSVTTNHAGAVHLESGVSLDFFAYSGNGSVFNFTSGSLGVFTADADASYRFLNNASTGTSVAPAITNSGTVVISDVLFSGNKGVQSGAITNTETGKMVLTDAVFSHNSSTGSSLVPSSGNLSAAIVNKAGGVMTLVNATFVGNKNAVSGGGVIDNRGTLNLKTTAGQTTLFAGNNGLANALPALYLYNAPTVNIFTASVSADGITPAGVLDMRSGVTVAGSGNPLITKTATDPDLGAGTGIWKIAGGLGAVKIVVEAGTLHLYGTEEVRNPLNGNLNAKVAAGNNTSGSAAFDIQSGATLSLGGGAHSSTAAPNITFRANSTLSVDLTNVGTTIAGSAALGYGAAWKFQFPGGTSSLQMDVRTFNKNAGDYWILGGGSGGTLNQYFKSAITVRGEAISGTRAAALLPNSLTNTANNAVLHQEALTSAVVTWAGGTSGGNWNINAANWTGATAGSTAVSQFLHGDAVNFANSGTATATILLNPTGDRTVLASGLYFSGDANYTFQGNAIEIYSDRGTSLGAAVATGKLILGAKATDASTLDTSGAAAYSGTVDLTRTGSNIFQDVDLYSGTLRISDAAQIGGFLNWFHFKGASDATANVPTLSIAAGKTVAFIGVGGAGGAAQRLVLDGQSGAVNTETRAGFVIDGASAVAASPGGSSGGAVNVTNGGKLNFNGTGAGNYTFSNNVSDDTGGAIHSSNGSTVAFGGSAAFIKNTAATGGGAISATGGSALTLNNAIFEGNKSNGGSGGAIYNSASTVTLNVADGKKSVFHDNTVTSAATPNSVHMDASAGDASLMVATAGTGTLYTLDPITVGTSANATTITKNGPGTWKLAGVNTLQNATVNITAGTVQLYATTSTLEVISVSGAIRDVAGTQSDYNVSVVPAAGVLDLTTGKLSVSGGAKLVLAGPGSAVRVASGGSVTIAPGAELVFKVIADGNAGASLHGVIHTNNLTVGSTAKLVLDLDPAFAEVIAAGLRGELVIPLGELGIPGLFKGANGANLTSNGELANFVISDTQGRFTWGMMDAGNGGFGGIRALSENTPVTPAPEPSTYALVGGLVALGFAIWRKRRNRERTVEAASHRL